MLRPPLRYVALGDSYTIGTGVPASQRWPDQLVRRLSIDPDGPQLDLVANLAVNGWTSADVLRAELPRLWPVRPDFVTLLIGVNDVVQGVTAAVYAGQVERILDTMLARLPIGRLVTVSTPDYTVTPAGADYGDPTMQAAAIREANALMAGASASRSVAHVDIHDLSLRAATEPGFVAADGLHPGADQYAAWVERIAPVVTDLLRG